MITFFYLHFGCFFKSVTIIDGLFLPHNSSSAHIRSLLSPVLAEVSIATLNSALLCPVTCIFLEPFIIIIIIIHILVTSLIP